MKKTYIDFLRDEMQESDISNSYIANIMDFFNMLIEMYDEDMIEADRAKLNTALAYLVVPIDVLPENVYGVEGYVDDIYIMSLVLKELYKSNKDLLEKHWNNDKDLLNTIELCYKNSRAKLEEWDVRYKVLRFAMINDPYVL